jgi:stage II sporulation protein R
MKNIIIIIIIAIITFGLLDNIKAEENIIPNEAIRLRVIANSNSPYDQYIKSKVRDKLQNEVYALLKDTNTIESARSIINTELKTLDDIVNETIQEEQYDKKYNIIYGNNYFPEKEYKGIIYEAGYYESLIVTLGDGKGDNWWCVLFPPLCLIEAEDASDVEYKFFVKEIITKYLKI